MTASIVVALTLIATASLYIHFRWHRSPHAYRAMIGLAVCYFVAGLLVGGCVVHLATDHEEAIIQPIIRPTSGVKVLRAFQHGDCLVPGFIVVFALVLWSLSYLVETAIVVLE